MYCQNCGQKLDDSAIYCEYCGVKVGKEDALKWIGKFGGLNRYYELKYELEDINDEIAKIPSKVAYLKRIIQSRDQKFKQLQLVRDKNRKDKKDYDSLVNWSFSSIKARMSGELDERKKKEQVENLNTLANFQSVETEYKSLEEEAKYVMNEVEKIQDLKNHIPQIESEMENILTQITAAKETDPLKEIESKYKEIKNKLLITQNIEVKFKQEDSYLIEAGSYLSHSVNNLKSIERFGTWDTFFGMGFHTNSLKDSDLKSLIRDINMAQVFVRKAKAIVEVIYDMNIDFEAPNSFFDMILATNFFDMYGNTRIIKTRERVENSVDKLNKSRINLNNQLIKWIEKRGEAIIELNRLRKLIQHERLSLL
jgi:hypothetical protein